MDLTYQCIKHYACPVTNCHRRVPHKQNPACDMDLFCVRCGDWVKCEPVDGGTDEKPE